MGSLWVLVFCILLVSPSTVLSHASLIKSVPARRAQIFKSPSQIQLWFSERLEARFSSLRVIDSGGKRVDLDNVAVDNNDPKRIAVDVKPLAPDLTFVIEGNDEIYQTYALFTQSFEAAGNSPEVLLPKHTEFLIDNIYPRPMDCEGGWWLA
jgi:methionine-rich copper-binding protein CopC